MENLDDNTPIVTMTLGQLKRVLSNQAPVTQPATKEGKQYAFGLKGIAEIFGCSIQTANQIKKSGKIDEAITQIGRKIVVDTDLARELAGRKSTLSNTRTLEKRGAEKLRVGGK